MANGKYVAAYSMRLEASGRGTVFREENADPMRVSHGFYPAVGEQPTKTSIRQTIANFATMHGDRTFLCPLRNSWVRLTARATRKAEGGKR